MLSRFALNDIVPEEFKTLSFNHVLLHKKRHKNGIVSKKLCLLFDRVFKIRSVDESAFIVVFSIRPA